MLTLGNPSFNENSVAGLFRAQTYFLAETVWTSCDRAFALAPTAEQLDPGTQVIAIQTELFAHLENAVGAAARIARLLRSPKSKPKGQQLSKKEQFATERAAAMQDMLKSLDLQEVLKTATRNRIEHFEEY